MKQVILVTGHYCQSKRKAGFHWLADAYHRAGWDVVFMTVGISWLSYLRRDHRLQYAVRREANRLKQIGERLTSYVWFTPYHPVTFFGLNQAVRPLLKNYAHLPLGEIEGLIPGAATVIFESNYGLMLVERFKRLNPAAKFIYRVSDDLDLLRVHPLIREAERKNAPLFDIISVPSEFLLKKFTSLPNAVLHPHGIRKDLFDAAAENPYRAGGTNAIFVGNAHLDRDFLRQAARLFPDWNFHIIGPLRELPKAANIVAYGEMPFTDTVGYLKFADVGLMTLEYRPGAESFTDSLKVIQYHYCQLPIVAPEFLRSSRDFACYYRPGDGDSIRQALLAAKNRDRSAIDTNPVHSWDDILTDFEGRRR